MYYALTAVWGLAHSVHISNLLAVVYDFVGERQMALLFGIVLFFEGIGAIIGAPICGRILY